MVCKKARYSALCTAASGPMPKSSGASNTAPAASLSDAIAAGLAPDGGLYVPEKLPAGRDLQPGDSLAATYRITLGAALGLELAVRNVAAVPVGFEAALHTYLAVSDVRDVAVTGLGGARYLDRLGGPDLVRQDVDVLRLTGETDRIYQGTDATVVVHDAAAARRLAVAKAGSASTVVWNPWAATGEAMADVGPAWSSMLCVETANVREHAVRLAPGTEHVMATSIAVLDPV